MSLGFVVHGTIFGRILKLESPKITQQLRIAILKSHSVDLLKGSVVDVKIEREKMITFLVSGSSNPRPPFVVQRATT